MSFAGKAGKFNDLVQASFRNAMDAVESLHQATAEIPLDVLKELGYPDDKAETLKESHRRILRIVYGGICSAQEDLGDLVVKQFGELGQFASGLAESGPTSTTGVQRSKASRKTPLAKSSKPAIQAASGSSAQAAKAQKQAKAAG
jgi:hypothetical protein